MSDLEKMIKMIVSELSDGKKNKKGGASIGGGLVEDIENKVKGKVKKTVSKELKDLTGGAYVGGAYIGGQKGLNDIVNMIEKGVKGKVSAEARKFLGGAIIGGALDNTALKSILRSKMVQKKLKPLLESQMKQFMGAGMVEDIEDMVEKKVKGKVKKTASKLLGGKKKGNRGNALAIFQKLKKELGSNEKAKKAYQMYKKGELDISDLF